MKPKTLQAHSLCEPTTEKTTLWLKDSKCLTTCKTSRCSSVIKDVTWLRAHTKSQMISLWKPTNRQFACLFYLMKMTQLQDHITAKICSSELQRVTVQLMFIHVIWREVLSYSSFPLISEWNQGGGNNALVMRHPFQNWNTYIGYKCSLGLQ